MRRTPAVRAGSPIVLPRNGFQLSHEPGREVA